MTVTLSMIRSSYGINNGSAKSYSQSYKCYDHVTSGQPASVAEENCIAALAALGIVVGTDTFFNSIQETVLCTHIEMTPVDMGGLRVFDVECTFVSADGPGSLTYASKDMNTSAVVVDAWRTGASVGSFSNPGNSDIGGTKIDQGGKPVSLLVANQELSITNYRADNNAVNCRNALGKRNSATYNGASAGLLLFTGAQARRVDITLYEVTYKITYDDIGHLRQVAVRDLDGKVMLGAPDLQGIGSASYVIWRQPFPATTDFAAIGIIL